MVDGLVALLGPLPAASKMTGELATGVRFAARIPAALCSGPSPELIDTCLAAAFCGPHARTVPVLLVHGYLGTDQCWAPLISRLHREGFVKICCLRYHAVTTGIPQVAAALTNAATTVMRQAGTDQVHLVGHSLGGLVIRYAVQHLGLDSATLGAVTIATPHRGSLLAWAAPGPAAADLLPVGRVRTSRTRRTVSQTLLPE